MGYSELRVLIVNEAIGLDLAVIVRITLLHGMRE